MSFAHRCLRPRVKNFTALSFEGDTQYVSIADNAAFNVIEYNTAWTIAFWYRLDQDINTEPVIISKASSSGAEQGWWIQIRVNGEPRIFLVHDRGAGNYFDSNHSTGSDLDDGVWHHVVMIYDGSGDRFGVQAYIDGSLSSRFGSGGSITATMQTTRPVEIGMRDGTQGFPGTDPPTEFTGAMDEIAIWDAAATSADAAAIYNGGVVHDLQSISPLSGSGGSLVGYWRLGENASFPTLPDLANGNDGTMQNMTESNLFVR